jgi:hypothetical protein
MCQIPSFRAVVIPKGRNSDSRLRRAGIVDDEYRLRVLWLCSLV